MSTTASINSMYSNTNLSLLNFWADDDNIRVYRPKLNQITGSVLGSLFLSQIIYRAKQAAWQPFYKFMAPCQHAMYRQGDSWQEELGFTRSELKRALDKIAVRITKGISKAKTLAAGALIIYWVDKHNVTHWQVNVDALVTKLDVIYGEPNAENQQSLCNVENQHPIGNAESDITLSISENITKNISLKEIENPNLEHLSNKEGQEIKPNDFGSSKEQIHESKQIKESPLINQKAESKEAKQRSEGGLLKINSCAAAPIFCDGNPFLEQTGSNYFHFNGQTFTGINAIRKTLIAWLDANGSNFEEFVAWRKSELQQLDFFKGKTIDGGVIINNAINAHRNGKLSGVIESFDSYLKSKNNKAQIANKAKSPEMVSYIRGKIKAGEIEVRKFNGQPGVWDVATGKYLGTDVEYFRLSQ